MGFWTQSPARHPSFWDKLVVLSGLMSHRHELYCPVPRASRAGAVVCPQTETGLRDTPTPRPGLRFPSQEAGRLGQVAPVRNAVVTPGRCPQLPQLEDNPVSNPARVTCPWHGAVACACQVPAHTAALPVPLRGLRVCLGVLEKYQWCLQGQATAADVVRQCLEKKVPGEMVVGNLPGQGDPWE